MCFNSYEDKDVALFCPSFSKNEQCALVPATPALIPQHPGDGKYDDVTKLTGVYYIFHVLLLLQYHTPQLNLAGLPN